jgi:CheY-like chemotaxis protein
MATRPPHHVLIVEDDDGIRETLQEILLEEGYTVSVAENGRRALDVLGGGAPLADLIVLDLMMPVMGGREFRAHQLAHPRWSRIPVIVISAAAPADSWRGDAARFVAKPFSLDAILGAVSENLANPVQA